MASQSRIRREEQLDDRKIEVAQELVRVSHEFLSQSKKDAFSVETTQAWNEYQKVLKRYNRLRSAVVR